MSKFEIVDLIVPTKKRAEINAKCLYLIDHPMPQIPADYIANAYTGDGGLHGLKRVDFDNYADFSKAKKEFENGQFFTPYSICQWIVDSIRPKEKDLVADLTCGHGAFFNFLPNEKNIYGCEIDARACKVAKFLYPGAHIEEGDVQFYHPEVKFDLIVGNPPFGLRIDNEASELYVIHKSAQLLKPAGILAVITPHWFLSDELLHGNMIGRINSDFNFIAQFKLPQKAFAPLGVHSFDTKLIMLSKRTKHLPHIPFNMECVQKAEEWPCQKVYETYIQPLHEAKEKVRAKIHREGLARQPRQFSEKVRKLLYDIARNGRLQHRIDEAREVVDRYNTQNKPIDMRQDEWERVRIHAHDVLNCLTGILKSQNTVERDEIRLVKNSDGLKLKAYSPVAEARLEEMRQAGTVTYMSMNDMVIGNQYPFDDHTYARLQKRKRRAYELQTTPYADMEQNPAIANILQSTELYDYVNEERVFLNPQQLKDTNLFLQKRYAFAQWNQGTGKTITGIFQALYRKEQVHNTVVLSSAISIKNNWAEVLSEQFKIPYILIERISDFRKIKEGQIMLITFDMLCKLKRQMKKYVKMRAYKIFFICDESDALSNPKSARTQAALACFRRMAYKLLLTGTSTRNNISEVFPQLELFYNNSVNMLCTCKEIYDHDLNGNMTTESNNLYYMKPFPPYRAGWKLFSACFLPDRITVFGIAQKTQDIYNSEELDYLLSYTLITRTFEEIVGRKIYTLHQEVYDFKPEEAKIYQTALEEFYRLEYLFHKTGNARKDAALKISNQLVLLLRICAAPQTIPEYDCSVMPGKLEGILNFLERWKDERVAIGVRHLNVVGVYKDVIQKRFPDRQIFVVTGNKVSLAKRKRLVKQMKESPNAILLCTQQSLSCSVNIDYIDKCLIPELHWNNSGMSQFYFRFIRYTSVNFKDVYFLTYRNSIESNLLKMVVVKEKLNYFMRQTQLTDDEVYEVFGIAKDLLEHLMYKEQTKEGVKIRWGEQMIA